MGYVRPFNCAGGIWSRKYRRMVRQKRIRAAMEAEERAQEEQRCAEDSASCSTSGTDAGEPGHMKRWDFFQAEIHYICILV